MQSKRTIVATTLAAALVALLAACSGAAANSTTETSGETVAANTTPVPGGFQMSALTQLLLGTFELEDTDQAVTAEQAQTLLPLWQAVQALGQSDTTAEAEMAAVEQQIQDAYTAEQISAIEALALSPDDMRAIMDDLGLTIGNFANGTPPPNVTPGAGGFDGGPFGGGPPPDGGFVGGPGGGPGGGGADGGFNPQDLSPEAQATFEARRAESGAGRGGAGLPGPLLSALIELLQTRAG